MNALQEAQALYEDHLSTIRRPKTPKDPKNLAIEKMMRQTTETQDMAPGKNGRNIFKILYLRRIARMKERP